MDGPIPAICDRCRAAGSFVHGGPEAASKGLIECIFVIFRVRRAPGLPPHGADWQPALGNPQLPQLIRRKVRVFLSHVSRTFGTLFTLALPFLNEGVRPRACQPRPSAHRERVLIWE
jgi:hypothetical protein